MTSGDRAVSGERRVWQCVCTDSLAVIVCYGDDRVCWDNGNGSAPNLVRALMRVGVTGGRDYANHNAVVPTPPVRGLPA